MCEIEKTPFVSIVCNTYNHVNFIRQCLDGFIMQQTSFPFEILVHDDASTDGTAEIVREYERNYPDLIKPIYQKENQYSKGVKVSLTYQYSRAKGKYIALCEGDDYWTDPLKLQKQVDFLEANPVYSMCFTRCQFYYERDQEIREIYPLSIINDGVITMSHFISGCEIPQTLTLLFRREMLEKSLFHKCAYANDICLYYFLLKKGPAFCIPSCMGCYRIHSGGVWSSLNEKKRFIWKLKRNLAICAIDDSSESSKYLLYQFTRNYPRAIFLLHSFLFFRAFVYLAREYRLKFISKMFLNKIFLNKNLDCNAFRKYNI